MTRRKSRDPDIELTAYHEAAHAVIALHYGWDLRDINVITSEPGNGYVRMRIPEIQHTVKWTGRISDAMPYWRQCLVLEKKYNRMLLAGPIAEAKVMSTPMRSLGAISDLKKVRNSLRALDKLREKLSDHVDISLDYRVKFFPKLQQETRRLLARPTIWKSIQVIADDLCEWSTITGDDAADTVQWVKAKSGQLNIQFRRHG